MTKSDRSLVLLYYEGCNQSIGELGLRYQLVIQKTAYKVLKDFQKAEDVFQDILIKLMEIPPDLRRVRFKPNPNNIPGALTMRAWSRSIELIRKKRNIVGIESLFNLEAKQQLKILDDELEKAINIGKQDARLTIQQIHILELHLNGYKNVEIAKEIGLEAQQIHKHIYRIRRILQKIILQLRN